MKKVAAHLMVFLWMSIIIGCSTKPTSNMVKDEKEISLLIEKRYKALNAMFIGNIDLIEEIWSHADDVTYMGPGGSIKVGWKAVLQDWKSQAALKLGGHVTPANIHYTIGRDMAVVVNDEIGKNMNEKGAIETVHIRATHVFRKENGIWKIIAEQTDKLDFIK